MHNLVHDTWAIGKMHEKMAANAHDNFFHCDEKVIFHQSDFIFISTPFLLPWIYD